MGHNTPVAVPAPVRSPAAFRDRYANQSTTPISRESRAWKYRLILTAVALALLPRAGDPRVDVDTTQPVRMGCGLMTFDTVPGWGLAPDGKSAIGPCHGGVAVGKDGAIYTSAHAGVFVFSPDGKVVRSFLGDKYSDCHDLKARDEDGTEFIYGARNNNAEGIKFNASTGEIVLKLPFPKESGLNPSPFNPTAITVAPNGDIFLADGYASNHVFKFDKTGKYLSHFGTKGNGLTEFNTAHGMTLDTRYSPPRLLICDRNHQPKGRLVHYDLDGKFLGEVVTGLGMPDVGLGPGRPRLTCRTSSAGCSSSTRTTPSWRSSSATTPTAAARAATTTSHKDQWVEGIFSGTHGSNWDKDGNLYVQDWNVSGRTS